MSTQPRHDPDTGMLDAIMGVMHAGFDPAYGEAWTRRQIGDALSFPSTRCLLADAHGDEPRDPAAAVGFALSRFVSDEEELLLIAVLPQWRGRGIGQALLDRLEQAAIERGVTRMFLEMRKNNDAGHFYRRNGYEQVGLRRDYYRRGTLGPIDALTFAKQISSPRD